MPPLVSVTIVTTNDLQHLERCFTSLFAQDYKDIEVVIVDNNSTDGSRELYASGRYPLKVEYSSENLGFCKAQNLAIAKSKGDWILCLNPDTKLEPGMISELVRVGELADNIGFVSPKILRLEAEDQKPPYRLDSTGMYITRTLRHLDRGSQETDTGQYEKMEYVFGYTGAAVLFRRRMIEDVSIGGEFMDEDFFFYREDGDLSWRAQLMGWKCVYTPKAVCFHVRRVFPTNRSAVSNLVNMHSTKNRFLMRIKNITPAVYRRVFWSTTLRDIGIAGYVLLRERSSLPGLIFILKNWKRTWAKRKLVQAKMRVKDSDVAAWFDDEPVAQPFVVQR